MSAFRIFWRVTRWARALRFWFILFAGVLVWLGFSGDAVAQAPTCQSAADECTKEEAYNACKLGESSLPIDRMVQDECALPTQGAQTFWTFRWCRKNQFGNCTTPAGNLSYAFTVECPPGEDWRSDLNVCWATDECERRNGAENGMPLDPVAKPFRERCVAGCQLQMQSGSGGCTVIGGVGEDSMQCNGVFQYSGQQCSAQPGEPTDPGPPAEESKESCTTSASGLKFCKKADGRECWESNGGAMICWGEYDTGQQTDGPHAQTRSAGDQEPQPDLPTPPEQFDPTKKRGPETTETTRTNPDGSTSTTTTTIVNNTTVNGTRPPGTPGNGGGDEGEGDEDGNELQGGGTCDQAPVASGDPLLGSIVLQTWKARCAAEKTLEDLEATAALTEGDDSTAVDSIWSTPDSPMTLNPGMINLGGGQLLPSIEIEGRTWSQPPEFFDALSQIRALIIALATLWAMFVVGRNI